ncbi:MAG: peroxidase, partial [Verrucomicrobiota bacterium]|nr:peroxidase [Verrucomicrobiota bacterium]
MTKNEIDYSDVQGLVRFGYGKMRGASYALVRVRNQMAAQAWLRSATELITTAEIKTPPPSTALQVAFTADGLAALRVPPAIVDGFSPEFFTGMAEPNRARRLGDIESNAASKWDWGYGENTPHLLIMFFAKPARLSGFIATSKGTTWAEAFEELRWLGTADLDGVEPFGFTDGISQPEIDWKREHDVTRPQIDYTNLVALGEFLLGYPNEYNKYTNRPLIDPDPLS